MPRLFFNIVRRANLAPATLARGGAHGGVAEYRGPGTRLAKRVVEVVIVIGFSPVPQETRGGMSPPIGRAIVLNNLDPDDFLGMSVHDQIVLEICVV